MRGAVIRWARGGEGRVVSLDARSMVVRSTIPSPPGSRIEGTIDGEPPLLLRMKVHSSRRQDDNDFVLEGRPLDLSRQAREWLESLVRPEGSTTSADSSG
jgi:hypothetical protein